MNGESSTFTIGVIGLDQVVAEVHGYRPTAAAGEAGGGPVALPKAEAAALVIDESLSVRTQMRPMLAAELGRPAAL